MADANITEARIGQPLVREVLFPALGIKIRISTAKKETSIAIHLIVFGCGVSNHAEMDGGSSSACYWCTCLCVR